jgi:hypothetical protein
MSRFTPSYPRLYELPIRPSAYRHNIHRDKLESITHTLKTRCIRTNLGKIKAHNHSIGNDLGGCMFSVLVHRWWISLLSLYLESWKKSLSLVTYQQAHAKLKTVKIFVNEN